MMKGMDGMDDQMEHTLVLGWASAEPQSLIRVSAVYFWHRNFALGFKIQERKENGGDLDVQVQVEVHGQVHG
ncbi:hypothetical protein I7I50_09312 [Histoplasma capsulatum G186AR]|uniref:Uncharacterized protein n=1 Tax=Ajellomyces capsulatus TaxID=5037 RepID=A0A8H7YU06_AJECA|nr:hypothetical protein I7I52_06833 [Histoplasma capsulatum]QSS74225.1 hypothetical protein I7I50_09312 [Histoplasma capsulatum G186AR]